VRLLRAVGRYDEAAERALRLQCRAAEPVLAVECARALRLAGRSREVVQELGWLTGGVSPGSLPLHVELGLALAATGDFKRGRSVLAAALAAAPSDRLLRFILRCPPYKHLRRATRHAAQGFHQLAIRDFEAVLLQCPEHDEARRGRNASLSLVA
jgi:tetratricopeptide (TPR) repeat protein